MSILNNTQKHIKQHIETIDTYQTHVGKRAKTRFHKTCQTHVLQISGSIPNIFKHVPKRFFYKKNMQNMLANIQNTLNFTY